MHGERANGFAFSVPSETGFLTLDLPQPPLLGDLDQDEIGFVVLDALGYPKSIWGLAKNLPFFKPGTCVFTTPLGSLIESGGTLYIDGVRYLASAAGVSANGDSHLLVINAYEERKARRQASKGWRVANTMRRLGKALTSTQSVERLCVAAAREITSTIELCAAMVWVVDESGKGLQLMASAGVNARGVASVSSLEAAGGNSCLAEYVADHRQGFFVSDVRDHFLTSNLEAKVCYMTPKGLFVMPLIMADHLIGVLELVGKVGDPNFEEDQDIFQTVAEHLTLALNSAIMYEAVEQSAANDALTGIPNHRSLVAFLSERLAEAERKNLEFSAIMIDVDHFRRFNEEQGHEAGDSVLKKVATALQKSVRPYDMAARYGGEEFTILLPGVGKDDVRAYAERARSEVEKLAYESEDGTSQQITISLGCAVYPYAAQDGAALLKAADAALYQAKRSGRNRVAMYEGNLGHTEGNTAA